MAKNLAINIALLPPRSVMNKALAINKQLVEHYGSEIVLSGDKRLPHITLSQAVIGEKTMAKAETILKVIASSFKPLQLRAKLLQGRNDIQFEVSLSQELQALHAQVMAEFKGLVNYDARAEYFYDNAISQRTIDWVHNFTTNAAYDHYYPHITLGNGELRDTGSELSFTAERLTIFQLGNYGTCRKLLVETKLSKI